MAENLIIFNARLVTPLGTTARKGKEMAELMVMDNATVEVTDGLITYVGPSRGEEPVLSTRTRTLCLAASVPRSFRGG